MSQFSERTQPPEVQDGFRLILQVWGSARVAFAAGLDLIKPRARREGAAQW